MEVLQHKAVGCPILKYHILVSIHSFLLPCNSHPAGPDLLAALLLCLAQLNLCFSCVESPEMSTPLSKSRRFSSFQNIDEEAKAVEKQGIVTILGSDCERTKAASLRRTLSADMSSKKWLAQNGFSPMKKIASSERISASLADSSSSSEGEEDYEERKEKLEGRAQFDMWSSILSQKANEDTSTPLPPPYIHPLVKRSASSLNEKSLEICTESLGSETGSDGFSSYPSSETGEEEEEEEQQQLQLQEDLKMIMCSESFDGEELRVAKYNNHYANSCKKSEAKSFPPPLPSLSREDGASLRMQSRRDNGRLVLEAVSVPLQNRFRAQRHDGRLVLTLVDSATLSNEVAEDEEEEEEQEELGDFEEVYDDDDEDEDEDEEDEREEEDEEDEEMEQAPTFSSRVINVHRLALMMNKPIGIAGRNPTWPRKFNEVVKFQDDETEPELTQVTKSLPPRPRVARLMPSKPAASSTASVNSYEYYWRAKPTQNPAAAVKNNTNNLIISKNIAAANDQNRGNKGDYFLPLSKGCKEPRRSLLFWEPYCIATS